MAGNNRVFSLPLLFFAVMLHVAGGAPEAAAPSVPTWLRDLKPVQGEFRVRAGHPRLFLTPKDLPVIRERIRTTHIREWESIQRSKQSADLTDRMLASAFCYQVEGNRESAGIAINAALELAAMDQGSEDDLRMAYRVWPESVVYDWCYDQFSPQQRERLLLLVRGQLAAAGGRILESQPPHAGHLVNHLADAHVPAGIAFYDDDPEIFRRALDVVRVQLAAKNIFYRFGASSQGNSYGVTHVNGDFRLLALLYKATGVDLFERFPFYRDLGYYWIYTRRPDGQLLRNGDDWLDDTRQNKWVGNAEVKLWTHPWLSEFLLYGAAKYADPYLLNEYLRLRDLARPWTAIEDVIWRDARRKPSGPESLPPIRYLDGPVGTLLFRTGWGMDDVVGLFKVMPLFAKNHDHLDRLQFQIYCRGALALDSGIYEGTRSGYDSDHWLNYFQRTIAHNSLLIRDPNEKLVYRGKPVNIDGGQFYPADGANADTLEAIADPQWRIARVVAAEIGPGQDYAFVTADATAGYGPKAELVRRTFVFLRGPGGAAASFLVADTVVSRNPAHEKVWLLHSMEQPKMTPWGVVIARTGGRNSGGTLVSQTVLPQNASIKVVGGPGQEFMVNGTDYPTAKGGDAEGGSWRVEVSSNEAKRVDFLHALQVYPAPPSAPQPVVAAAVQGATGAEFADWSVLVSADSAQTIDYVSHGSRKRRLLVLGLPALRPFALSVGERMTKSRTSRSGSAVIDLPQQGDTRVSLSFR